MTVRSSLKLDWRSVVKYATLVGVLWAVPTVVLFTILKVAAVDTSGETGRVIQLAGTVGDAFGMVNALFAGLAFAFFIYAIVLQHHELELTREELELTRNEVAKTAVAQEKQVTLGLNAARVSALAAACQHFEEMSHTVTDGVKRGEFVGKAEGYGEHLETLLSHVLIEGTTQWQHGPGDAFMHLELAVARLDDILKEIDEMQSTQLSDTTQLLGRVLGGLRCYCRPDSELWKIVSQTTDRLTQLVGDARVGHVDRRSQLKDITAKLRDECANPEM